MSSSLRNGQFGVQRLSSTDSRPERNTEPFEWNVGGLYVRHGLMTRAQLSELLYALGVPADVYRLDGSHFELAHVLDHRAGWVVFLSERGTESDLIEFASEDDACVHLLGRVCLELVEREQLRVVGRTLPDVGRE